MKSKQVLAIVCALASATSLFAQTTITFDDASSTIGSDLGNFYPSVTFGPTDQVSGQLLPEFPAHSLPNFLTDVLLGTGQITWNFTSPQASFSFFYDSLNPGFTGTVYDTHGNVIGTISGTGNVTTPDTTIPLEAGFASGSADIGSVVLIDPSSIGGGLAIDDLTFTATVPDTASTLAMFGVAALGLFSLRRKVTA